MSFSVTVIKGCRKKIISNSGSFVERKDKGRCRNYKTHNNRLLTVLVTLGNVHSNRNIDKNSLAFQLIFGADTGDSLVLIRLLFFYGSSFYFIILYPVSRSIMDCIS